MEIGGGLLMYDYLSAMQMMLNQFGDQNTWITFPR
jgi:hypothetical protein